MAALAVTAGPRGVLGVAGSACARAVICGTCVGRVPAGLAGLPSPERRCFANEPRTCGASGSPAAAARAGAGGAVAVLGDAADAPSRAAVTSTASSPPLARWPSARRPLHGDHRRPCTTSAAAGAAAVAEQGAREHWDLAGDRVEFKHLQEDIDRFVLERTAFRNDPRLQPGSLPTVTGEGTMDGISSLKALVSILRLSDLVTEPFRELVIERLTENAALVEHFGIPVLEDLDSAKPLHNKAVPQEGMYIRVRMQAYWLALHVWLIHSKQHLVQEGELLFGSALCAYLTRRLFEWQWNQLRGWLHDADVPVMSITAELQDLQEYIFGFCAALDTVFKEEAPQGTAAALAVAEEALPVHRFGLAPRVKHVLWANVYSGSVPHDDPRVHDLAVYLLRQRVALEALPRGSFFTAQFSWAEFSW